MSIIFILLPISLVLGLVFLGAYLWSAGSGQFEDLETPALRILNDDIDESTLKGRNTWKKE